MTLRLALAGLCALPIIPVIIIALINRHSLRNRLDNTSDEHADFRGIGADNFQTHGEGQ